MRTLSTTLAISLFAAPLAAETLVIYSYDSFASDWGPGPAIVAGFAETCGCAVELVAAGDGAALLSRLQLEGAGTRADVVIGLDNFLMERARATGLFAAHDIADLDLAVPDDFTDDTFLPFDWGAFAFVAGRDTPAPESLRALADSDLSIVIQDPRASTPGLGLALWVKAAYGEEAAALWGDLADNIVTVTPGWTEAYNLFLEGEADAVLSYTTSPAYHVLGEEDDSKTFWSFSEGHLVQVEVAALTASSEKADLGRDFLRYLAGEAAQAVIPETNWMFPVLMPAGGLDPAFGADSQPATLPLSPQEAAAIRDAAVADWQNALAR